SPAPAPAAEPKAETTEPAEDKPVDIEAFVADHGDLMSSMLKQTGILLAMYFLLIVVVFIHFVFVFYLHFDNPDDSVFTLFKKSAGLMRKNCFRLIRLVFRAGGKNLAVAAAVFALTVIIPDSKTNAGSMRLFVLLLNFVYFINAYTALLKMYFAFPILYTARLEENTFTDEQKDALILAGAVALLSNEESQESSSEQKESDGE
ncbi:MAG: hypothetical protein IJS09_10245, partial [Treponema sp.]|nr:hypothetical protein [Treponema sp.]